ncbi:MAG: FKBP-type peptidyl-prolyl cis-trans isomerase [Candidatus Thermoplasmatota archaeon]
MKPVHLLLIAAVVLAGAGCTGLPEGAADFGDTVTVRYSATDLNGVVLRPERTATFVVGSGSSGLGLGFERGVRGLVAGENATFVVSDDPSLGFNTPVEVDRALQPIPMHQDAPRQDFEDNVGPASVGQQFAAFGIYTATVTAVHASTVNFTITTSDVDFDGESDVQEDAVASVGAILVTTPDGTFLQRSLKPNVGATFTVQPPSASNPQTPLGLTPGTYRTLGATEDKLQYAFSTSTAQDLIAKDVRFKVTVVRIVAGNHEVEPVDGNYAARNSPYVNGDPDSVLGALPADVESDDHAH